MPFQGEKPECKNVRAVQAREVVPYKGPLEERRSAANFGETFVEVYHVFANEQQKNQ